MQTQAQMQAQGNEKFSISCVGACVCVVVVHTYVCLRLRLCLRCSCEPAFAVHKSLFFFFLITTERFIYSSEGIFEFLNPKMLTAMHPGGYSQSRDFPCDLPRTRGYVEMKNRCVVMSLSCCVNKD